MTGQTCIGGHDLDFPQFTPNELRSMAAEVRNSQGRRGGVPLVAAEVAEALSCGEYREARLRFLSMRSMYPPESEERGAQIQRYLAAALEHCARA